MESPATPAFQRKVGRGRESLKKKNKKVKSYWLVCANLKRLDILIIILFPFLITKKAIIPLCSDNWNYALDSFLRQYSKLFSILLITLSDLLMWAWTSV